ncbi:unnamed protein product [Effrenium voratum]|nr:unnamed protein product [Effrenium voratum]
MSDASPGNERFKQLLNELTEEHETALEDLKATVSALREELVQLKKGFPSKETIATFESCDALREEASKEKQEELGQPQVEASEVGKAFASAQPRELKEMNTEDEDLNPVSVTVYSVTGLPSSALGNFSAPLQCFVSAKSGLSEMPSAIVELEQEFSNLNTTGASSTWKAEFEEGTDLWLQIPTQEDYVLVELQAKGTGAVIATATVKLNAVRQPWMLDCGGLLDAEAVLQKGQTPAGKKGRRNTMIGRIQDRLEFLFAVKDPRSKVIMARDLFAALRASKNPTMISLGMDDMDEVLIELRRIHQNVVDKTRLQKFIAPQPVMSWKSFTECIVLENLPKYSTGPVALNLFVLQRALLGDEMPATGTSSALLMAYQKVKKPRSKGQRYVSLVTGLSTFAILLSFAFMGISLDNDPDWYGWVALDGTCAVVFVAEVIVKTCVLTASVYFCGRDCLWNIFDVGLSLVAVSEIILNILFFSMGSTTKAALILRGLRLARMARLAKLMRMPLLEELANIISGFVISVRSLFWVMICLALVVYVMSLAFRATVQTVSTDALSKCGYGDSFDLDPGELPRECKLHYMYGEEYCGSVFGCMFSIFRCMIGDCTTKGGRSLTMIFSDGFGLRFDIFYAFSMVCVIFGLFNIITAIFVEATLNGLKENEAHRRYAKAYESTYMTEQLAKLVMCVSTQVQKMRSRTSVLPALLGGTVNQLGNTVGQLGNLVSTEPSNKKDSKKDSPRLQKEIYLNEEEFNSMIRNPDVRVILNDLHVSVEPRPGIFEAFNTEEDGTVSVSELVSGLMRLRGDLHKVDLVIAQMTLEQLGRQVQEVKRSMQRAKDTAKASTKELARRLVKRPKILGVRPPKCQSPSKGTP